MKVAVIAAAFAAFTFATACQKKSESPPDPPAGTKVAVVRGMENQIFVADSPQHITFKKNVTGTPITDPNGVVRGTIVALDNNEGLPTSCACSGGCTEGDGDDDGPIVIGCVTVTGPNDASCSGNCSAPNKSCAPCQFWYDQPSAGSLHAKWVKRIDLVVTQK